MPVAGGSTSGTPYTVWRRNRWTDRFADLLGTPPTVIADLSALNIRIMKRMIEDIRRRAEASGWASVPVVLENHTKDVGDFRPFEQLAAYIASQPDLEVVTLREVHDNLAAGVYTPVSKAGGMYQRAHVDHRMASAS